MYICSKNEGEFHSHYINVYNYAVVNRKRFGFHLKETVERSSFKLVGNLFWGATNEWW